MKKTTFRMALVLLVLMIAAAVPAFALSGSGTEADPYLVATEADLLQVSGSAYYKQTANIVLNDPSVFEFKDGVITGVAEGKVAKAWKPIENFSGTYNGGVFFITGLYVEDTNANGGLFGTLNSATVKDLNLDFALVQSDEYAGILAAKVEGTSVISECMTAGTVVGVTTKAMNTAGGLAGLVGKEATVSKSVSYATVTGATSYSANVGGLVGINHGTITGSGFGGKAYGTATYYDAAIGGIAGYNAGEINNSRVAGTVGGESTATVNDCFVGGVAGLNKGSIANCQNDSTVSVLNVSSGDSICAAGGIVGMTVDGDITECTNNGAIGKSDEDTYAYHGGIAGIAVSDTGAHYVDYCDNKGAVTAKYGVAGGIVGRAVAAGEGYISIKLYVEECYNEGKLVGLKTDEIAGETSKVESAQAIIGEETAANSNTCSAYAMHVIKADAVQYGTSVSASTTQISKGTSVRQPKHTGVDTSVADKKIIRCIRTTSEGNHKVFIPAPVYVTLVNVKNANELQALSVDASGLNYADGRITGNIVVEVYRPEGDVTAYNVVTGTSVGNKFAAADFATVEGAERVTKVTVPVDCEAGEGTIYVTALVVSSTDSMEPLCESVETSK